MRYTRLFVQTLREVPRDVRAPSHRLLLQGGYLRPVSHGLFSFTPLGMRVIKNLKAIIREEMDALGGQEVLAPLVNPRDIWDASGRSTAVGRDMVQFDDREGRHLVLAPTHEEAMVELVRQGLRSYRDLPVFVYQIQTKFRDEERVRCGLVRAREFIMKDGYSFHRSFDDLNNFFPRVFAAYHRIFNRCHVPVIPAQAGVGYMGGDRSYEFLMPSECGDDFLMQCDHCAYAANQDVAVGEVEIAEEVEQPMEPVPAEFMANARTLVAVRQNLELTRAQMLKAMLYRSSDQRFVMAVLRGDHEVSEEKLIAATGIPLQGRAREAELHQLHMPGPWLSPLHIPPEAAAQITVVLDETAAQSVNLLAATNSPEQCLLNVTPHRDVHADRIAEIIRIPEGSRCRHCTDGILKRVKAMELGNIFRLGTHYTRTMSLSVIDDRDRHIYPHMGSYGIGLGRLMAAIVDANRDDAGIIWPGEVAPFRVHIMSIGKSLSVRDKTTAIYESLSGGNEDLVLLDDRHESISRKFKDADLMGIPLRVVVSQRTLSEEVVELSCRGDATAHMVPIAELSAAIAALQEGESPCLS